MKACLQTFGAGIAELLSYLQSSEDEEALMLALSEPDRRAMLMEGERILLERIIVARVGRKQYIYAVAIIALYGLLERFVDSVIESYVHRTASLVDSYARLPSPIVTKHTQLSLELAKAIAEQRHYGNMTEAEVIANLHLCLSGSENFRVNGAAFVLHRGNLFLGKITDFLSAVGIENHLRRVSLAPEMLHYLEVKYPGRDIRGIADSDLRALFEPIDSLVERRNEISHGVLTLSDIESIELLEDRCAFLTGYVHGLYRVVLQDTLKLQTLHGSTKALGRPIAVFNHSIVCFAMNDGRVARGDIIAAATNLANEPFRFSRIESLQVNNAPQAEIVANGRIEFGVEVSFYAQDHYDYFVLSPGDAF